MGPLCTKYSLLLILIDWIADQEKIMEHDDNKEKSFHITTYTHMSDSNKHIRTHHTLLTTIE